MGSRGTIDRLIPYLADFDTTVAATAATLLSKWSGNAVVARPVPLPIPSEPLASVYLARGIRLRVTMAASSGGGSFTMTLFSDEAPATVARMIRLAKAHYFDGLTFQRVEPNFVIQGGSPGATEYVGDGAFMRDELTSRTHRRGTAGISSRGRDTGDAQLFINLIDNPRLDHDYTVFGEIITGRAVAERVMEGDIITQIEVLGAP
jgi:cyclophilin family peptidyl-prolyl cis-trans isomerase